MRRSATLLTAATLAVWLAAAGAAHADLTLGGLAAQAAADGRCVEVAKSIDATTGKTIHTDEPVETDCPDGTAAGSVIYVTDSEAPPTQQKPSAGDPYGLGTTTRTTTVQGQPPLVNPYTTTVVKPTPKTASTTTPAHH